MHSRSLSTLSTLTGVLAVGEFVSAGIIAVENYPGSFAAGGVIFGILFLVATWLLRSRRVTAGTIFVGVLCLFEVVQYPGWDRRNALDWVFQSAYALVALAGLATAVAVLVSKRSTAVAA